MYGLRLAIGLLAGSRDSTFPFLAAGAESDAAETQSGSTHFSTELNMLPYFFCQLALW